MLLTRFQGCDDVNPDKVRVLRYSVLRMREIAKADQRRRSLRSAVCLFFLGIEMDLFTQPALHPPSSAHLQGRITILASSCIRNQHWIY